jgi:hypothetical protein
MYLAWPSVGIVYSLKEPQNPTKAYFSQKSAKLKGHKFIRYVKDYTVNETARVFREYRLGSWLTPQLRLWILQVGSPPR